MLSSRSEGTPIVLFDAMDTGVPIIATQVGGVPDMLGSEEARLVASEDAAALVSALRELYSDREIRLQVSVLDVRSD